MYSSRVLKKVTAAVLAGLASVLLLASGAAQTVDLGTARHLAPGIDLYHSTDPQLLSPAGPVSVWMLRLDPALVDVRSALANDAIVGTETVDGIARRHAAFAAINAGFFLPTGDPAGIMKLSGMLISDTARARGAVGILPKDRGVGLVFGQLRAFASVSTPAGRVRIDGVDTARAARKLMLYTPEYDATTGTAESGVEWILEAASGRADRLTVREIRRGAGASGIPRSGCVLSYGGSRPPAALRALRSGDRVALHVTYQPESRTDRPWRVARDIIGGAGLLAHGGTYLSDWAVEKLSKGFPETRHPRTMIGTAADGTIWMIVIDGRQPLLSVGMNFAELQALARRLSLVNVLNLDGGGSTTMWVQGRVVNSPSDASGPRKVSDALLVYSRPKE